MYLPYLCLKNKLNFPGRYLSFHRFAGLVSGRGVRERESQTESFGHNAGVSRENENEILTALLCFQHDVRP